MEKERQFHDPGSTRNQPLACIYSDTLEKNSLLLIHEDSFLHTQSGGYTLKSKLLENVGFL